MSYTIEQVKRELREELETMSSTFELTAGDVNYLDHGGVLTRKTEEGEIEFIIFSGVDVGYDNPCQGVKLTGEISLEDLIERLEDVWEFADGKNCGFNIGNLIYCSDSYSSHIREISNESFYTVPE